VRRRVHQITYEELTDVVGIWVEAALPADAARPQVDAAPGLAAERPAGAGHAALMRRNKL